MWDDRLGRKLDKPIDLEEFDGEILHDGQGEAYEISDEYHKQQLERQSMSIDKEMELQLAKELLNSNLKRLTPKQRDVIYYTMLRYSQKEIAEKMKLSPETVKQHLYAAQKKLAKIITGTKQVLKEGLQNGTTNIDSSDNKG